MPSNPLFLIRNEQVSGSSPLVGSLCSDLQAKRRSMERPRYRVGTFTGTCTPSIRPRRLSSPSGASLMSKNGSIAPQVNPDLNLRTLAWPAPHLDLPSQTFDPLAHRRETHARPSGQKIEPSAVVNNLYQHSWFSVRNLTSTLLAPEWRRALVRASCSTRNRSTLSLQGDLQGILPRRLTVSRARLSPDG